MAGAADGREGDFQPSAGAGLTSAARAHFHERSKVENDYVEKDNERELGLRFWVLLIGMGLGAMVVGVVLFLIFGELWYRWGFFGAFLALGLVLIGWGYWYDRRQRKRRERLADYD